MSRFAKAVFSIMLGVCMASSAFAQNNAVEVPQNTDSVAVLLNARAAMQRDIDGESCREVLGPATFLHNGAYLFCDSAIWHVDSELIEAYNNVRIVQDKTILTSDRLKYFINDNLAQFRGVLVELKDDKGNSLRSNNLDYNTKDSVATFSRGGSMIDSTGNVIEGYRGSFDQKISSFKFELDVEMFMDTLLVKTAELDYHSDVGRAFFPKRVYMWKDSVFMKAEAGWYDRNHDVVMFNDDVYMRQKDYEVWTDTVYYHRNTSASEMYGNVQLLDSLHSTAFVSHKAELFTDSLTNSHAVFTVDPALIYYGKTETGERDTMFVAMDTLKVYTRRICDMPADTVAAARKAKEDMFYDAILAAENKAVEDFNKKKQEAEDSRPETIARKKREKLEAANAIDSLVKAGAPVPDSLYLKAELEVPAPKEEAVAPALEADATLEGGAVAAADTVTAAPAVAATDTLAAPPVDSVMTAALPLSPASDSLDATLAALDSLAAAPPADTLPPLDTLKLRFIEGFHDVRMYRSDLQARCDLFTFSEIDSIAHLYTRPVMWNKIKNQLTSETMSFLVKDGNFDRGIMTNDSMIISQEDSVRFDQIKSKEMLGYFRDNQLYRYDALGGVTALFYLREKDRLTTANLKEAQFMMVRLNNGEAERMKYYENVKSDAYPVPLMEKSKQKIKGFEWRGDERPKNRAEVTTRSVRPSERSEFQDEERPLFRVTDIYYENHMSKVYQEIADKAAARARQRFVQDSIARAQADSLAVTDSLAAADSMKAVDSLDNVMPALHSPDSIEKQQLAAMADSLLLLPADVNDGLEKMAAAMRREHEEQVATGIAEDDTIDKAPLTRKEKRALRRAQRKARRYARRMKSQLKAVS